MTKHTQGPWLVEGRTVYALNDDGYNRFSALVQDAHTPGDELEANARLIAAAPDLLEALDGMIEAYDDGAQPEWALPYIRAAHKAIAKARGEA